MNTPRMLLRGVAIAIAVAGLIDPSITVSGAPRPRLAVVTQVVASPSPAADQVRARLVADLASSFEVVPAITSDAAAAIVVGDRYVEMSVAEQLPIATVTLPAPESDVRIVRIDTPGEAPVGTAIHVGVDLEAQGAAGRTTELRVQIGGLEVGRGSHVWAGEAAWRTALDVVPVGEPPYVVRVEAVTADHRTFADALVEERREPFRVHFYEPRPSWAVTFVRRALESDGRFLVGGLSFSSRSIASRTRDDVPLNDPRLDASDVVIVGGLEKLTAADARSLQRFMQERGGAVVLLPDERLNAGPVNDLLAGDVTERLLEQPAKLVVAAPAAAITASELLLIHPRMAGTAVVASLPTRDGTLPVMVSTPRGDGRLFVSGAMDAWRFRAVDEAAFDRFWRSTIAGLALAAPPRMAVSLEPAVLPPGGQGRVTVRLRARDAASPGSFVSATMNGDQQIRLTPAAEAGVFDGIVVAGPASGRSRIDVEVGGSQPQSASRRFVVQGDARPIKPGPMVPLSLLSASHRGIDASPEHLADIERFVRTAVSNAPVPIVHRPMRSAWWIIPFAGCLSAEWWFRRRRGLR